MIQVLNRIYHQINYTRSFLNIQNGIKLTHGFSTWHSFAGWIMCAL